MECLSAPPLFSCDPPSRPWCCPRDLWVARDIILPYSLTYMRLMIEALGFVLLLARVVRARCGRVVYTLTVKLNLNCIVPS